MSLATADIHVRIDPEVKRDSEKILSEIGISMSDLINITLRKLIRERRLEVGQVATNALPENLRIETKDQLVRFLKDREQENAPVYTSEEMGDILSKRLGVSYGKI